MRKHEGFTLIELLIVVAIIAILAAIAVPNFLESQTRAKISRTKADLRTLNTGMETYFVDHNTYPPDYDSGRFGASYQSEWRTYACLTTPVAYLASVPRDIFQAMANSDVPKEGAYYQFNGLDQNGNQPSAWQGSQIRYMMTTVGPDLLDQRMWGHNWRTMYEVTYDSSNGTRSSGDIGRSNVGPSPQ